MNAIEYRAEIRSAYIGEVAGAVTAAALVARADFSAEQREKVRVIGRLELYVAYRLEPMVSRLGLEIGDLGGIEAKARSRALATKDWNAFIGEFGERLQPFIDRFERLKAYAAPEDLPALQLLADHEHALAAFGRHERAGQTDQSMLHLLRLLPEQG